jgi:hypothetical protein
MYRSFPCRSPALVSNIQRANEYTGPEVVDLHLPESVDPGPSNQVPHRSDQLAQSTWSIQHAQLPAAKGHRTLPVRAAVAVAARSLAPAGNQLNHGLMLPSWKRSQSQNFHALQVLECSNNSDPADFDAAAKVTCGGNLEPQRPYGGRTLPMLQTLSNATPHFNIPGGETANAGQIFQLQTSVLA